MRRIWKRLLMVAVVLAALFAGVVVRTQVLAADNCVTTNLFANSECDDGNGNKVKCYCGGSTGAGIGEILMLILNILSGLVLTLAMAGITIAGIQYLSARDNDSQVAKAKNRLLQVTLGLLLYALMWALLNWLVPGGVFNNRFNGETSSGEKTSLVEGDDADGGGELSLVERGGDLGDDRKVVQI